MASNRSADIRLDLSLSEHPSIMQSGTDGPKFVPSDEALLVPVRRYLPSATAEAILRFHAAGRLAARLPGERKLCEVLQVSRGTLRQALHILRGRGELVTEGGRGHRLLGEVAKRADPDPGITVRFLSPEPLESRRAFFSLMLDKVQEAATARGWRVLRDHGAAFFGDRAEGRLEQLVVDSLGACWVLVHSSRAAQEWFSRRGVPVMVSGHTYPGIALPSLDVDHRASGYHAGTVLAQHGHEWVAMVVSDNPLPGLAEGEKGFYESFEKRRVGAGRITRLVDKGSDAVLGRALRRVFEGGSHPTAIVVETPAQYILAFSLLAQLRKVIPSDVSLISRLDDPFMRHFEPSPARYCLDPVRFSRALVTMVTHLTAGEALQTPARKIIPEFVAGRSVSVARPS